MGTIGNVKPPCSNSQWFYAHSLRKIKFWVTHNTKFKRGLTCQWVLLQHQSCLYLSFQTKASLRNCLKIDLTHSIFVCKNKQIRVPNLKILCFFFYHLSPSSSSPVYCKSRYWLIQFFYWTSKRHFLITWLWLWVYDLVFQVPLIV